MPRRKNRIYRLTIKEDPEAFPIEWNQLPDEVLQNTPGDLIYDIVAYSRSKEEIVLKSVLYFKESKRLSEDSLQVDNKKGVIFEIT